MRLVTKKSTKKNNILFLVRRFQNIFKLAYNKNWYILTLRNEKKKLWNETIPHWKKTNCELEWQIILEKITVQTVENSFRN